VPSPFAPLTTRPYEIRFAYPDAAGYRPVRDEQRGGGQAGSADAIAYGALEALEQRKDIHALAIARAWNGDDTAKLAARLRAIPQTAQVRSDAAALELLTRHPDDVEPVLAELERLRGSDDPAVARAARWNYAVLLARLDLPRSAAQAFEAIAGEHEPGWADEARARAVGPRQRGELLQTRWEQATRAGQALVATGAAVPIDLVRGFPGVMRTYFYNAVRTASSRERVLALGPMAAELDKLGDRPVLTGYVERVAGLDFQRRAPLAAAYARVLQGAQPTDKLRALLVAPASADVADIIVGTMVQLDAVAGHRDAFRAMTERSGDPWFHIVLAKAEATAAIQRGDWLGAEAQLRNGEKLCGQRAVAYQCMDLRLQLGKLYEILHRIPEALAVVQIAIQTARSAGEWRRYTAALWQLADLQRLQTSTASARAYAGEVLLTSPGNCDYQSNAYRTLTGAALFELDGRAARQALEQVLRCAAPDLRAANYLTDIGRFDPQPGDLPRLQTWLSRLRNGGTLSPVDRLFADEIEGRLLIERDRAAGIALLEGTVAAAGAVPRDVTAMKARAGAYAVLIVDAARHGDHARVVELLAQELGLATPATCMVGMVAEDERAAVVVRGADGRDRGTYNPARRPGEGVQEVPPELARRLEGCAHVQVLAHGALQGQPHVLPAALPWSYITGARQKKPERSAAVPRTLIVTDVIPPVELKLPVLSPEVPEVLVASASTHTLSGAAATPSQVLAAMADASEIQLHTHALVDLGVSDASFLVLSPEPDGRYALTAEAIRGAELREQPLIVLAACHSAQGAKYHHAPWSLPHAFLAIGARAVFAAGTTVPDREAGPFFTRVLERVHAGSTPASALRDERVAALAAKPSSWVADVMLFE